MIYKHVYVYIFVNLEQDGQGKERSGEMHSSIVFGWKKSKKAHNSQDIANILFFLFFFLSTGCILGVGLVLSFLSHSSQTESRVHVSASLRKLCAYLDSSEDQSRWVQEVRLVLSQISNFHISFFASFNNSAFYWSFLPVVLVYFFYNISLVLYLLKEQF